MKPSNEIIAHTRSLATGVTFVFLLFGVPINGTANPRVAPLELDPYSSGAAVSASASLEIEGCNGLSLSFWRNWRAVYSESQFRCLLRGTMINTIERADAVLSVDYYTGEDSRLEVLEAMLLVHQLTMELAGMPEFPNPKGAGLADNCCLVAGCRPGILGGYVEGCGKVNFAVQCDLAYWLELASEIIRDHRADGCSEDAELFECTEISFDTGYLFGEVNTTACVLGRFADRNIARVSLLPSNPY